jgi:hypothetical protein
LHIPYRTLAKTAPLLFAWKQTATWRRVTILVACAITVPAAAATNSSSFSVSATVVAACAIAPRLPARLGADAAVPRTVCAATPALPATAAPQPVVTLTRDATGLTTLKIEF